MSSNQPDQLFWAMRWTLRDVVALVVTAVVLGSVFTCGAGRCCY
jgi:hypothetical protein